MNHIDINQFMAAFHAFERDHALFNDAFDGELWWDAIRYDACCFLFECVSRSAYASANIDQARPRQLGVLRRAAYRRLLYTKARLQRGNIMAIGAPRTMAQGRRRDMVLDPIADLFPDQVLKISTLPRRYHLPDFVSARWPGRVPPNLADIVAALIRHVDADESCGKRLEEIIRRSRGEFANQVAGYHRLFERAQPAAVMLVQNGIEKALFHVATIRGIPSIEAQHGVIGFGHPQYSYAPDLVYDHQTTMPDIFLTFSHSWTHGVHYPAGRHVVVGTDSFAIDVPPVTEPLGDVMICSANIYHDKLLALTRKAAEALPRRSFLYKLHPNQAHEMESIRDRLKDLPNVTIGPALTPATDLMKGVSHVVAVQSTVVYEALQQGRRVVLVPMLDYAIHADVFDLPAVDVVSAADDLIATLQMPPTGHISPIFFERFMPNRARDLIASLLAGGKGGIPL